MLSIRHHLLRRTYGTFTLTNAIRPGHSLPIIPQAGYRLGHYEEPEGGFRIPMLTAAVSSEVIFDCFRDLTACVGDSVHVLLESSHDDDQAVQTFRRHSVDIPVLDSYLCEFEDLLLHDGCTAVTILGDRRPVELRFDDHKLLHIYARKREPFLKVLRRYGIQENPQMQFVHEAEHLHHSTCFYQEEFQRLTMCLGAEEPSRVFSDDNC